VERHIEIELCEPQPFIFGANGHLGVTDGSTVWIVVVTEEAMHATSRAAEASLQTLVRHAALYREMAEALIARGRDQDGKVWIFEGDVAERENSAAGGAIIDGSGHTRILF
jgi:hypothetical protein